MSTESCQRSRKLLRIPSWISEEEYSKSQTNLWNDCAAASSASGSSTYANEGYFNTKKDSAEPTRLSAVSTATVDVLRQAQLYCKVCARTTPVHLRTQIKVLSVWESFKYLLQALKCCRETAESVRTQETVVSCNNCGSITGVFR